LQATYYGSQAWGEGSGIVWAGRADWNPTVGGGGPVVSLTVRTSYNGWGRMLFTAYPTGAGANQAYYVGSKDTAFLDPTYADSGYVNVYPIIVGKDWAQ
jgi:hypothetical protein